MDPMRDAVDVVGGPFFGFEKWEGGVLSRGGAMYCVPLKSSGRFAMVNPSRRIVGNNIHRH